MEGVGFLGVAEDTHVGDGGLDFSSLEELFFFDADVRDVVFFKGFRDIAGGEVSSDEDGEIAPVELVFVVSFENLVCDPFVFVACGDEGFDEDGGAVGSDVGDDALGEGLGVGEDDALAGGEDVAGGAEVLFKMNDGGFVVVLVLIEDFEGG